MQAKETKNMKKIAKDVLHSILILLVIIILDIMFTRPFDLPWKTSSEDYINFMNRELLFTAFPVGLVTFVFEWQLKTQNKYDAIRRSIIWTIVIFLNYFHMGSENSKLEELYSTYGLYVLLIYSFAGPLIYVKLNNLKINDTIL
jgi:hypothetical protein